MTPVKVVLSNGEGDEVELGPFNQGVVTQPGVSATIMLFDVASSREIACVRDGGYWYRRDRGSASDEWSHAYKRCYVQSA